MWYAHGPKHPGQASQAQPDTLPQGSQTQHPLYRWVLGSMTRVPLRSPPLKPTDLTPIMLVA